MKSTRETTLTDISGGKEATKRTWLVESTSGNTNNVVLVQGDYNASKAITVKFTATGSYRVTLTVTNEYGTDNVTKTHITVSTVGIAEVHPNTGFSIYPNPASNGILNIHLAEGNFDKTKIQLMNINGSVVLESMAEAGSDFQLNTSGVSQGVYYLSLSDLTGIVSKKVVIQ